MQYGIPTSFIDEETRKQMFQRGRQPIKSRPGDFAKMGFGGEGIIARNPFGSENAAYKEKFPEIKTAQQALELSKDPIKLRSYGITEEDALAFARGMSEKEAGIEAERESIGGLLSKSQERKKRIELGLQPNPPIQNRQYGSSSGGKYGSLLDSSYGRMMG